MSNAPERIYAWVHRDQEGRMTHGWHGKIGGGGPEKTDWTAPSQRRRASNA